MGVYYCPFFAFAALVTLSFAPPLPCLSSSLLIGLSFSSLCHCGAITERLRLALIGYGFPHSAPDYGILATLTAHQGVACNRANTGNCL